MITLNSDSATSPNLVLAELIESAVALGNADRAGRLETMLSEAIAALDRSTKAPAATLVRELGACKVILEKLRDEAKQNSETSNAATGKLSKMVTKLKTIEL